MKKLILLGVIWLSSLPAVAMEVFLSEQQSPVALTIKQIDDAKQTIQVVLYKFNNKDIYRALKEAVKRGVKVTMVVDEEQAEAEHKNRVDHIEHAGAKVIRWSETKLHAKLAIYDQRTVVAGSFNWTKSAEDDNTEIVIVINEPDDVAQFVNLFNQLEHMAVK